MARREVKAEKEAEKAYVEELKAEALKSVDRGAVIEQLRVWLSERQLRPEVIKGVLGVAEKLR